LIDRIAKEIDDLVEKDLYKSIALHVHPFIAAYIQKGLWSIQAQWSWKYKKWISIIQRDGFQFLQHHIEVQKK
jgi:ribonuclease G